MDATKHFDPRGRAKKGRKEGDVTAGGDRLDGLVYVWPRETVLAVNIAIATARPLLVSGPPGTGKSSLAPNVARITGRRYLHEFVTSRTQSRDLLYRFDALRRLRDAQAGPTALKGDQAYIVPGVLWEAFDPEGATAQRELAEIEGERPSQRELALGAVVLLDEIDKADPDVPNSLLEALGELSFTVGETGFPVEAKRDRPTPLVILTTNDERELSKPFLRRCVVLPLPAPDAKALARIAKEHGLDDEDGYHVALAEHVVELRDAATGRDSGPSTAEYLDALRARRSLNTPLEGEVWEAIERTTLLKPAGPASSPP